MLPVNLAFRGKGGPTAQIKRPMCRFWLIRGQGREYLVRVVGYEVGTAIEINLVTTSNGETDCKRAGKGSLQKVKTPDREAPVGAEAARSGNFWSPGLNDPTPL